MPMPEQPLFTPAADAAKAVAAAVVSAPIVANAAVQAKGPGIVAFLKAHWYLGLIALGALILGSLTAKGIL